MRAFTLIELLVVLAIIAVIAGLLLQGVNVARDNARSAACQSALRQIGIGSAVYAEDQEGYLPDASQTGKFWTTLVDPYLEKDKENSLRDVSRVLWGCPIWRGTTAFTDQANSNGNFWRFTGYAINVALGRPTSTKNSDWWFTAAGNGVNWFAAKLTIPSNRMLYGDGKDNRIYLYAPGVLTASMADTQRHRMRANYVFCDLHVGSLTPSDAVLSVEDPARMR